MFNDWIRRQAYWTLDFMRNRTVREHYRDVFDIMENNRTKKIPEYLMGILDYASKNVAYYKPYSSFSSLNDFPIINKNIINEHYGHFQAPGFPQSQVVELFTSGSTGLTPFAVRQDINKRNRVMAEMMYFWGKAGYRVGMKYIYFRRWTPTNRKSKLTSFSRNLIMQDVMNMDNGNLERIRQMLKKDRHIKMLLGYASALENLANYLISCGDSPDMFRINTIISIAEVLQEPTRSKLVSVFGCPVFSHYSNGENGVLAQECQGAREFHVNGASYIVELLELDSDVPVPVSKPGRIVITDLFNRAMPLIRNDTGDIGIWKSCADCDWNTQVMLPVQGRQIDSIFNTEQKMISPYAIGELIEPFGRIMQYQFCQHGARQYTIRLVGAQQYYEDEKFIESFRGLLGQDAEIEIEHVSELPLLTSGKLKQIICNYRPDEIRY